MQILVAAEQHIKSLIENFVDKPIEVFAGGVAIIAGSFVTVWFIYRLYMILAGFSPDPVAPLFKDFFVKIVIISVAGSTAFFQMEIVWPLYDVPESMAKDISSFGSSSIFKNIDNKFTAVVNTMEALHINQSQDNAGLIAEHGDDSWFKWLFSAMATVDDAISNSSIVAMWDSFWMNVKVFIVFCALCFFAVWAFIAIVLNQVFFNLCLAVGPLFLFFLAFDATKGWFSSWFNTTLGYAFSYPMIVIVVTGVLKIFDTVFQPNPVAGTVTWTSIGFCVLLCVIFSVIIMRAGDLASAFFSAGNIADGTALALTALGYRSGGKAIRGAGLAASGGMATARGAGKAFNYFRRGKIKEGK